MKQQTWVSQGRRLKKVTSGVGRVHIYVQRSYVNAVPVWESLCNTRMFHTDVEKKHKVDCLRCLDIMELWDLVEKFR